MLWDYASKPDALKRFSLGEREDLGLLLMWGLEFLGEQPEDKLLKKLNEAWLMRAQVLKAVHDQYEHDTGENN